MFTFVQPQALRAAESSPTDVAAVRPLPRVEPEMVLEARRSREALVALRAVKLLPEVDFLMLPQAAGLVEAPVAHGAVVRPLPRVRESVSVHGPRMGEALPAVRAGEGFLPRVDFLVTFELTFLGELLPTQRALKRFLSRVDSHVDLQRGHLVTVSSTEPTTVRALCLIVCQWILNWGWWRTVFFTVSDTIGILFRHWKHKWGELKQTLQKLYTKTACSLFAGLVWTYT